MQEKAKIYAKIRRGTSYKLAPAGTLILSAIFTALSSIITAQSIGTFHFGGNMSRFIGEDAKYGIENMFDFKFGYQVGFTQTFGDFYQFEPGVFLINKGARYEKDFIEAVKTVFNLNYLQLPVNFKVNFKIGNLCLVGGLGVYAGLGLWGNVLSDGKYNHIEFFSKKDPYRALDFGGQILVGAKYSRVGACLGWQSGFTNISKDRKINNSSFTLNLSYVIISRCRDI